MKTDKLIDMILTNVEVETVDRRQVSRNLRIALAAGVAISLCAAFLILGIRPDLANAGSLISLCLKLLFAGIVVVLGAISLNRIMRPGGERRVSAWYLVLPFAAIVLLAVVNLATSPSSHWNEMLLGNQWLECLVSIPIIAIVPFAVLVWAVRQAAPTNLSRAGALVGLIAGGVSAMGYAVHCGDDSVPFVALWYGGTIALCTFAGWKLGPRLLRW